MKTAHKILLSVALLCTDNTHTMSVKKRKKIPKKNKNSTVSINNPIFLAARTNNKNKINEFLDNHGDINIQDQYGRTAAMIAAKNGNLDVLQLLVKNNADTRIQDDNSKTALDFAKEGGWKNCFEFLVKRSGKKRLVWYVVTRSFLNRFSYDSELGLTPQERKQPNTYFFSYIKKKNYDKAKNLLLFGADINAREIETGETSLHLAARAGNLSTIKFLLLRGAYLNPVSKKGETPLHIALRKNYKACVDYLIAFGANINARDKEGNTMLHKVAQEQDSIDLLKCLIEYKADIKAKNKKGETPLWFAFGRSRMNAVKVLLNAGANINTQNVKGETILHDACHKDKYLLVKELLVYDDIDLTMRDNSNKIPLHVALHNGHKQILDELLKHTDKMNIKHLLLVNSPNTNKLIRKLMKPKDGCCIVCFEECVGYMIPCANAHPVEPDFTLEENKDKPNDVICYRCICKTKKINNKCPKCRDPLHQGLFDELCNQHENQLNGFEQITLQNKSELLAVKS